MSTEPGKAHDHRLYTWVRYSLAGGIICSLALLAIGLALWVIAGAKGESFAPSPNEALRQLLELQPIGILALGVLVILATPVLTMALALVCFWREGDKRYAFLALAIVALSLLGLVLASVL